MKFFPSNQLLDANFLYRFIFKYLGIIILLFVTPFLFLQSPKELALFLIIRSMIRIFITFLNNYTGGQNFYRNLSKTDDIEAYFVQWFKNIVILISIFAIINIVFTYAISKNLSYKDVIDSLDLFFIFLWFFSSALLTTFSHYFQVVKKNFSSGISQGLLGNLALLISVLFFFTFYEINFTNVIFSFGLSSTCSLLFNVYLFLRSSTKDTLKTVAPIQSILKKDFLYEGISESTRPIIIFFILIFSSYLYDENITSLIGMTFMLYNFIYFLPLSYELSSRTSFLDAGKIYAPFKRSHDEFKRNLIYIYIILSLIVTLLISILNLDFFRTMLLDMKIDSVILALIFNLIYIIIYIFVSMRYPRSILICLLFGSSKNVFKINSYALGASFVCSLFILIFFKAWLCLFLFFITYEITKDALILRHLNDELIVQ